jgi:membrane protease YdiL (CAAX protease family)
MPRGSRALALTALGGYNLVQNLAVPPPAYVPANLIAALGLLALARRDGCSWRDLGLDPADLGKGIRTGLAGSLVALVGAAGIATFPSTRPYLLDQRAAGQSWFDVVYRGLIRFPLGTALFEEVAFRGVIQGLWRRSGASRSQAETAAALSFGLWHLLPATTALAGNPLGPRLASRRGRRMVVMVGATGTGLAGLLLSWLRERSGSLVAPLLVHASVNSVGYLASVLAWRLSGPGDREPQPHPPGSRIAPPSSSARIRAPFWWVDPRGTVRRPLPRRSWSRKRR